jgi:hypothetical protein
MPGSEQNRHRASHLYLASVCARARVYAHVHVCVCVGVVGGVSRNMQMADLRGFMRQTPVNLTPLANAQADIPRSMRMPRGSESHRRCLVSVLRKHCEHQLAGTAQAQPESRSLGAARVTAADIIRATRARDALHLKPHPP